MTPRTVIAGTVTVKREPSRDSPSVASCDRLAAPCHAHNRRHSTRSNSLPRLSAILAQKTPAFSVLMMYRWLFIFPLSLVRCEMQFLNAIAGMYT